MKLLPLLSLLVGLFASSPLDAAPLPESRRVDELLAQGWAKAGVKPNAAASDEVIVRRLYLDIIGRIPTVQETRDFLGSKDADKRAKLIDRLLASEGCASHMFNYWADVLRISDSAKGPVTTAAYADYVKRSMREDKPYDVFVRELVTARGGAWDNGAIGYYMRDDNKLDHLAYTVQIFLGTQIICAQCHDHPFDKWEQLDFYGMAAFTYGMLPRGTYYDPFQDQPGVAIGPTDAERKLGKEGSALLREIVRDVLLPLRYSYSKWDERKLPVLPADYKYDNAKPGQEIAAKVMFGHEAAPQEGEVRVDVFGRWLVSPENPRFTKVIANRMWKKVFGLGLIEPVDDLTDDTKAENPELLDYLTGLMRDRRYSLKSYLRVLYNTDAYQQAVSAPGTFAGPPLRRMSAEQVWDSLVTLVRGNVDGMGSEQDERVNKYLGDLKALMDAMREKGPAGVVAACEAAAAKLAKAKDERYNMRRGLLPDPAKSADMASRKEAVSMAVRQQKQDFEEIIAALVGPERAANIMGKAKSSKAEQKRAERSKEEMMTIPAEERRAFMALAGGTLTEALRASELSSPAKPGHFLRTFGQSDREGIQNGSDDSSVPQFLALLNGPFAAALIAPDSQLGKAIAESATPAAKLETLCLALLSRRPSEKERAIFEKVQRERGERAISDMTYALLNSAQFIFIQ